MFTLFLHLRLAPKEPENTLWIADQEDLDAISHPLSRIMARHSPIDGGPAGDVGDAIEAAIAVGGYAIKNTVLTRQLIAESNPGPGWEQQAEANAATETPAAQPFQPFPPPVL